MGPGCFYPGNVGYLQIPELSVMLQWGRDVSIPEGADALTHRGACWGRDVSIPEIAGAAFTMRSDAARLLGPGCFYPGNDNSI